MQGNMRAWIARVTIWIWVTSLIGQPGPGRVFTLAIEDHEYTLGQHEYNMVSFTTESATKESYMKFMEALRHQLASDDYRRYEIPVLRELYLVEDPERFLLVKLSNHPGAAITLALDVTNANVVAYQSRRESFFFSDAPDLAFSDLFTRTEKKKLSFGGSSNYPQLEKSAGANRKDIDLGIYALDEAISSLYQGSRTSEKDMARSLIVIIQLVTEAARFRQMEKQLSINIKTDKYLSFRPGPAILSLESNWASLSTEIQESNQGVFTHGVLLQRANGQNFWMHSVSGILKANLALLLFVCRPAAQPADTEVIIRPFIMGSDYDDSCLIREPTTKIIGRDGRCLDVRQSNYSDGTEIIMHPCRPYQDMNQLWKFKRDGTIRSNGKCLTTYNYSPESYVMIFNCSTAPKSTTRWVLDTNGSIINPASGFSLTADEYDYVNAEPNIYSRSQGWVPSNETQIFVTSIVGFKDDLCLVAKGNGVWVEECSGNTFQNRLEQQWAIYPDGTIRPQQTTNRCLTCNSGFPGTGLLLINCRSSGWSSQRWMFNNDGTIMNLRSNLVLQHASQSEQISVEYHNGSPNQKWLPLF